MKMFTGELIENPSITLDESNKMVTQLMFRETCFTSGGMVGDHAYENYSKGDLLRVYVNKNGVVRQVIQY